MVSEQIRDLQGMSSDLCVDGYRCLLCGNLVDAMILEHKQRVNRRGRRRDVAQSAPAIVGGDEAE
jgi:hypothetical protein